MERDPSEHLEWLLSILGQARKESNVNSLALWCCGQYEQSVGYWK